MGRFQPVNDTAGDKATLNTGIGDLDGNRRIDEATQSDPYPRIFLEMIPPAPVARINIEITVNDRHSQIDTVRIGRPGFELQDVVLAGEIEARYLPLLAFQLTHRQWHELAS